MFIETSYNGSLVGNATSVTFGAHVWINTQTSDGVFTALQAPTNFATGHYNDTWTIPSNATIGSVEWIHIPGTYSGVTPSAKSTGVAGITIVGSASVHGPAPAPAVQAVSSNLSTTDSALPYAAIAIEAVAIIFSALSMRRRSTTHRPRIHSSLPYVAQLSR